MLPLHHHIPRVFQCPSNRDQSSASPDLDRVWRARPYFRRAASAHPRQTRAHSLETFARLLKEQSTVCRKAVLLLFGGDSYLPLQFPGRVVQVWTDSIIIKAKRKRQKRKSVRAAWQSQLCANSVFSVSPW